MRILLVVFAALICGEVLGQTNDVACPIPQVQLDPFSSQPEALGHLQKELESLPSSAFTIFHPGQSVLESMRGAQEMDAAPGPLPKAHLGTLRESINNFVHSNPSEGVTTAPGAASMAAASVGCSIPIACNYDPEATSSGSSNCDFSCWTEDLGSSLWNLELGDWLCSDLTACNYNPEVEESVNAFCLYDMDYLADVHGLEDSGSNAWLVSRIPDFDLNEMSSDEIDAY